jgi:hypothetical protein
MIRDQLHIDEQGIGWRIVQAVSFDAAEAAIAQAKVSGSVAHTDTENGVTLAEVKRDVPECHCTPAIGMRHSPYCPIFAYEVANDERAGRLPPRMLANMLPGRLKVLDEAHTKAVGFRKSIRQAVGRERAPLRDVYPVWETDEHGDEREVWYGNMRIVRNRKRMRKLKRRGVMFMDLRAKTGNKHPDGFEGPRAWAWFTPRDDGDKYDTKRVQTPLEDRTTHYQTLTTYGGDVPAGTREHVCGNYHCAGDC